MNSAARVNPEEACTRWWRASSVTVSFAIAPLISAPSAATSLSERSVVFVNCGWDCGADSEGIDPLSTTNKARIAEAFFILLNPRHWKGEEDSNPRAGFQSRR